MTTREPSSQRLEVGAGVVHMRWDDLAFVHWRADAAQIAALLPPSLEVEEFDGSAWIGLVPFTMRGTSFSNRLRIPYASDFLECNVRTYVRSRALHGVRDEVQRGVWFFSLDATSLAAVVGARTLWHLPYLWSRMRVRAESQSPDGCKEFRDYSVARRFGGASGSIRWTRGERMAPSAVSAREDFLTNRDRLFSFDGRRTLVGVVRHVPWTLHHATLQHVDTALVRSRGVDPIGDAIICATPGVDSIGEPLCPLFAPIVFFDGECAFCHRSVQRLMKLDRRRRVRFAPLQGATYASLTVANLPDAKSLSTMVLLDEEGAWTRSDAVIRALHACGGCAAFVALVFSIVPRWLRDQIYDAVAKRRTRSKACDVNLARATAERTRVLD